MSRRFPRAASIGLAAALVSIAAPIDEGLAQPAAATRVSVRITVRTCAVSRKQVPLGAVAFSVLNQTKAAYSFAIAGRRKVVKPRRRGSLSVTFRKTGRVKYTCAPKRWARGAKPKRGTLTVVKASRVPGGPPPPPPPSSKPPPPQPPPPGPPPGPPPPPMPQHRLGVRTVGGFGEFYDKQTGLSFVPRGSVFVRRRLNQTPPPGPDVFSSSTFAVGAYDSAAAENALEAMNAQGYNVVRIFLDVTCRAGCLSDTAVPDGLSRPYLGNLVDFLRRAKTNGLYVLIAAESLPYGSMYETIANGGRSSSFDRENVNYLTPQGADGYRRFWIALIQAMNLIGAPLDNVWGYEIVAEQFYRDASPPLSLGSGTVVTANGQTYDMGIPAQKQQMMDDNLTWFADRVRSGILSVDSTALVGMGFLWPKAPNPARAGDPRVVRTRPVIDNSTLDFFDLHLNPGVELTFPQYMQNFELTTPAVKPVVLGEFGALKFAYPTAPGAEHILRSVEADSCPYGIDGWLHWSWDTTEFGVGELPLWEGTAAGSLIDQALGPLSRPDPCAAVPPDNLALGQPVTASAEAAGQPATNAVDGLMANSWSSGGYPYQWIQIDLGAPVAVGKVRLFVTQYPDGSTTHRILTRGTSSDPWTLQYTFSGATVDNQVLEYSPASAWPNVRYVMVDTPSSVSWVAWKEIEVYGP